MKVNSSRPNYRIFLLLTGLILFATTTGCSERLMRENVFANTETGLGIFLAQNAKTQLYEAKLGYFRHELFFVPTSKTITYKLVDGKRVESEVVENDPSLTPEVLAVVAIGARAKGDNAGFDVRQRLAVGKIAVTSKAATALMTDDASDAAALAAGFKPLDDAEDVAEKLKPLLVKWKEFQKDTEDADNKKGIKDFDDAATNIGIEDFESFVIEDPSIKQVIAVRAILEAKGYKFKD
ncbi:MAG: hypothetical protein IH984_02485 [Planctomycetes bacterium]|nr:hypothetical protein [Planctomycetota bacterium]